MSEDFQSSQEASPEHPTVVIPPGQRVAERPKPSFELLDRLVDVEQKRIESQDRRTEVMKLAIQSSDDADKRQFDYRIAKLNSSDEASKRRDALGSKVLIGGLVTGTLVFCFLLGEAFFGDQRQSEIAVRILIAVGTALGGYGLVTTFKRAIRRFFDGLGGPSSD